MLIIQKLFVWIPIWIRHQRLQKKSRDKVYYCNRNIFEQRYLYSITVCLNILRRACFANNPAGVRYFILLRHTAVGYSCDPFIYSVLWWRSTRIRVHNITTQFCANRVSASLYNGVSYTIFSCSVPDAFIK